VVLGGKEEWRGLQNGVLSYIEKGKAAGAKVACGGGRVAGRDGYFVEPTIFTDATEENPVVKEEIFGPVLVVLKFKDVQEVIDRCNNTEYGLAAAVATKNISNVFAISNNVKAGTIWVNTYHAIFPQGEFGGFKQSGFGREGGVEGVAEWTQVKTVIINTAAHQ